MTVSVPIGQWIDLLNDRVDKVPVTFDNGRGLNHISVQVLRGQGNLDSDHVMPSKIRKQFTNFVLVVLLEMFEKGCTMGITKVTRVSAVAFLREVSRLSTGAPWSARPPILAQWTSPALGFVGRGCPLQQGEGGWEEERDRWTKKRRNERRVDKERMCFSNVWWRGVMN